MSAAPLQRSAEGAKGLVITVCPRERGCVTLPVSRGARPRRMNATTIARVLQRLIGRRKLGPRVTVQSACAGGCTRRGPNVSVTLFSPPRAGERSSHVAVGWRTYVYSLASLSSLEQVLDDNLGH